MQSRSFSEIVHASLAATRINDLMTTKDAVILERLARGGGATRWYYCPDKSCLSAVENKFSPGSAVSFYFDGRIKNGFYSFEVKSEIERIIIEEGEAVIGCLLDDGLLIEVELVSGPNDLVDFASNFCSTQRVFYGAFPSRDNDGERAVTVVLPDDDGIVRAHPH